MIFDYLCIWSLILEVCRPRTFLILDIASLTKGTCWFVCPFLFFLVDPVKKKKIRFCWFAGDSGHSDPWMGYWNTLKGRTVKLEDHLDPTGCMEYCFLFLVLYNTDQYCILVYVLYNMDNQHVCSKILLEIYQIRLKVAGESSSLECPQFFHPQR